MAVSTGNNAGSVEGNLPMRRELLPMGPLVVTVPEVRQVCGPGWEHSAMRKSDDVVGEQSLHLTSPKKNTSQSAMGMMWQAWGRATYLMLRRC